LFLTDMYLPSGFIENVLRREGFFHDADRLFVSGELKRSKHNGLMFEEIRRLFPDLTAWRHTGDNIHADVRTAEQFGIQAKLETRCHSTRYGQLARGGEKSAPAWRSKMAGAMRLARLENPETDEHRRTIWDTSCEVAGPLLFGFVHWCLEMGRQRGLRRLYFVARDGQILHRLAKVITSNWNYEVECLYLYGSRQAWHPAAIEHFTKDEFPKFFAPTRFLSLHQVFERLGLNRADFQPQLKAFDLDALDWMSNLNAEARQRMEQCLQESGIASAVEAVSRVRREFLLAYLRQERVLDGTPFALVDIGWYGNLQNSLARVLQIAGGAAGSQLTGFYFGLAKESSEIPPQNKLGYWNALAPRRDALWRQNLALFEILTAADHGSVMGFERKENRIVPKFVQEKNTRALSWGLATLQAGVLRFAEHFSKHVGSNSFTHAEFFTASRRLLHEFYTRPSATEALAWGSFQYSDGQTEAAFELLVPNWNRRQIMSALIHRKNRPSYWWYQGSLATCPCLLLDLFLVLKQMRRRFVR